MQKKNARSGVNKRRKFSPGKRLRNTVSKAVADRKAAIRDRRTEIQAAIDSAVRAARAQGFEILTPDGKFDSKAARQAAEAAAVEAAAAYNIDIRKANGKIDPKLARQAAEAAAIQSAQELGFDITNSRGKISRRKALEAARATEAARAGRPVSAQLQAKVSRQDARLAAELKAAERQGFSITQIGGEISRRDAYTDAELAALIRRSIYREIA